MGMRGMGGGNAENQDENAGNQGGNAENRDGNVERNKSKRK